MHLPLAFSIHHFVSSVGADAGFAAIVGLAILVLLYFAQARETSTLRDESVAASQRVAELERRLTQLDRSRVAPMPPAVPAADTSELSEPAAPAGVGAPPLSSATRWVPVPPSSATGAQPDSPAATPRPATAAAAAQSSTSAAPEPSASAQGSNGTGENPVVAPPVVAPVLAPSGAADADPADAEITAARVARPSPARISPVAAYGPQPSPLSAPSSRRRARRIIPAVVIALLVAAAVVALLIVTSVKGSSHPTVAGKTTNAPAPRPAAPGFRPASVTVAVLNGTDVFQLAHRVSVVLHRDGYRSGTVATATDQTHPTTLVGYLPGHRQAAIHVAGALKLPSAAVQLADQSAQAIACPPPGACQADVIVTVGSDLDNTP